ncbi:MAG TPA: hypothetical protein VGH80_07405 [Xanthomonadaceae bacterium]|jgi:hypothetical protein
MRTSLRILLSLLLLLASGSAFGVTVDQKTMCQNTPVPTGWVVVNKTWNRNTCGNPVAPQGNVWTIDEFDNLPVGTPLTICGSSAIPSGWIPTSFDWNPAVCGAQYSAEHGLYNTIKIRYVNCTNESNSLCYPSLTNFAVISALPKTVQIPYGQSTGSSEIAWFAPISVCVWVTTESTGLTQLWSCSGNSSTRTWPFVAPGVTQTFKVSASSTSPKPVLASVAVKGVEGSAPRISASPTVVVIPAGKTQGNTKVSYNLNGSDYPAMCIWVSNNGASPELVACGTGTTFSQTWTHVPRGGTSVFWLNPSPTSSSQILASVTVKGQ